MSKFSEPFVGYVDGSSHSTQNLSFAAWAIFAPSGELMSFRWICIGRSTNNIAVYSVLIELLSTTISLGIRRIIIRLDSHLIVLQITSVYTIWNSTIHHMFLRVYILERYFVFIQYQHISINLSTLAESLANYVLNRHLQHM